MGPASKTHASSSGGTGLILLQTIPHATTKCEPAQPEAPTAATKLRVQADKYISI